MRAWQIFWLAWLLTSGCSFALITVVVVVKGAREMKEMLAALRPERHGK